MFSFLQIKLIPVKLVLEVSKRLVGVTQLAKETKAPRIHATIVFNCDGMMLPTSNCCPVAFFLDIASTVAVKGDRFRITT